MTDRDYMNVLLQRMQSRVDLMQAALKVHPENSRGTFAAHVAQERLQKVAALAKDLQKIADAAL